MNLNSIALLRGAFVSIHYLIRRFYMSDLFGNQSTIDIDLFYIVEKTKSGSAVVRVLTDEEAVKIKADPAKKDKVKQNRFSFRTLTWAASNQLLQRATEFSHVSGSDTINWNKYRDQRLKTILISWDIKDEAGATIPVSESAIDALSQNVALALLERYDEDAQEKNG
jgi:hypothetical protein